MCAPDAKTFSLYCALEKATDEVGKNFEHRGAAMQEARFVIEEIAPDANRYSHRLMDYNNDPKTSFADIQGVFWLLEKHIAMRLANPQSASGTHPHRRCHQSRSTSHEAPPRTTRFAGEMESRRHRLPRRCQNY